MIERPIPKESSDVEDLELLFQRSDPAAIPVNVEQLLMSNSTVPRRQAGWPIVWPIALTCLAVSMVLLVNVIGPGSSSQAFAQVKERVERVRTVEFIERHFENLPAGVPSGQFPPGVEPRELARKQVALLEQKLATASAEKKSELELRLTLIRPLLDKTKGGETLPSIQRIRIKGKTMSRQDHVFPFENQHVNNAVTGKSVTFDHQTRKVTRSTKHVVADEKTGKHSESEIEFGPTVDFFHRFRALPEKAIDVGSMKINGRSVIGYRTSIQKRWGTMTETYWIDKQTHLPVKIVSTFISPQDQRFGSRWEQTDFKFDAPIDSAIFSTATPQGYTEEDGVVFAIKMNEDEDQQQ